MVKHETANGRHSIGGEKNASGIMSIRIVKDREFQAITNFHWACIQWQPPIAMMHLIQKLFIDNSNIIEMITLWNSMP